MYDFSRNLAQVNARIRAAASAAGRGADEIDLIAVSKTHPAEAVKAALQTGQRLFGENRVQEAAKKFPGLREAFPGLTLHLIGPLQTNKIKEALELFDVIQTLDRPKLAEALAREIQKQGRAPRLYIEINTGREPQKAGIAPEAAEEFLETCAQTFGLSISGLMAIPPFGEDPAPHFAALASLGKKLGLPHLSMGMSADFETAIAQGATDIRLGTVLFGAR